MLDLDAEWKTANGLLLAIGDDAVQHASDQADDASLHGEHERAAYWRRITALNLSSIPKLSPASKYARGSIAGAVKVGERVSLHSLSSKSPNAIAKCLIMRGWKKQ
jgi:hypothetical protein